jgi:transcriptional regulator of met regulon
MYYQKFSSVVTALIQLNLQRREANARTRQGLSPSHWAAEFCTIHVDAGRQTGKTDYITRAAWSSDLIIVPNSRLRDLIQHVTMAEVTTGSQIHDYRGNRFPYETIFVDEPKFSLVDATARRLMYENFAIDGNQTFVLLGA